jgi:hypothetical protein
MAKNVSFFFFSLCQKMLLLDMLLKSAGGSRWRGARLPFPFFSFLFRSRLKGNADRHFSISLYFSFSFL